MILDIEGSLGFRREVAKLQKRGATSSLLVSGGEEILAAVDAVGLKHSTRRETVGSRQSGGVGVGVRLGPVGIGGGLSGGSHASSTYTVDEGFRGDAPGELVITTHRVVFLSSKKTVSIPFAKLTEAAHSKNNIRLSATRGAPILLRCKHSQAAVSIIAAVKAQT